MANFLNFFQSKIALTVLLQFKTISCSAAWSQQIFRMCWRPL